MRKTGFADYRIVDENGLTQADSDKIAAIDGVYEVALTFVVSLAVSLLVAGKNKNIDMVESLKMAD